MNSTNRRDFIGHGITAAAAVTATVLRAFFVSS